VSIGALDREWDVVVVGAGPAGALAARETARRGARVLLADRAVFPREKVCGSCVNLHAAATLRATGLGSLLEDASAVPLRTLRLSAPRRSASLPLPGGHVLSRASLDLALVEAARSAGVRFLPGTRAEVMETCADGRQVTLTASGESVALLARVVVDAAGLSSATAVRPGARVGAGTLLPVAPPGYCRGVVSMAWGAEGYVGIVQVEDGRLDVACALDPRAVRSAGGVGALAGRIVERTSLPRVPELAGARWRGTPPLTRRAPELARERLFRVGDAASFVEPFTGQGIAWALASGAAVAPLAVAGAVRWEAGLVRRWESAYASVVARRQRECRAISRLLRRPRLMSALVGILSRLPGLAVPVLRSLNRAREVV
jgi:flavin-dependent dehydrogenase